MIKTKKKLRKEIDQLNQGGHGKGIVATYMRTQIANIITLIAKEIQEERSEKIKKRMERILQSKNDKSNEIWKVRRNLTNKSDPKMSLQNKEGNLITNPDKIKERYVEYYQDLLHPREPDIEAVETIKQAHKEFELNMQIKKYDGDDINTPFSENELEKAMKKLKDNKCPGHDGVTNEVLKAGGNQMKKSILKMMNWLWQHEVIPSEFKNLDIKSIYKGKGQTSDLKNHRGVCIGVALHKLYETMIDTRSSPIIENKGFTENQAGGRRNRGIADHLFIIRAVLDHSLYFQIIIILELLDLVKAFDKMQLKLVMNDLWQSGIRGRIWRTIYEINKESIIYIKTPLGITEGREIGETVKQGSVLASKMASLHTDGVNRMFTNTGLGIQYGSLTINNLIFQDDIIKIENSEEKLNKANRIYNWFAQINGMKFHELKSEWISNSKEDLQIRLDDKPLKRSAKAKYLGDILTPDGKIDETIAHRKSAVTGITAELSTIMDEVGETRIEALIQYHNGIIIPKMLTNAETWSNISKQNIIELEKIQNTTIKRLLRLPKGTPSNGLRAELGLHSMKWRILKKKLMYIHKIINYPDENLTKNVLLQQRLIPSPSWLSKLQEECQTIGIELDFDQIALTGKQKWVVYIDKIIKKSEEEELVEWMKDSKKYKCMQPRIKLKEYCVKLPTVNAINILKARLGMIHAKDNYHNMYKDISCPICKNQVETTEHLISCNMEKTDNNLKLMQNYNSIIKNIEQSKIKEVQKLSILLAKSIERRASTLDASPPPPPLHSESVQQMEGGDLSR